MKTEVIKRPERTLKDDPTLLSPPVVAEPHYQYGSAVTVFGFVPNATIELDISGSTTSFPGGFPFPNGVTVPLVAGRTVRARQKTATATSPWSNLIFRLCTIEPNRSLQTLDTSTVGKPKGLVRLTQIAT